MKGVVFTLNEKDEIIDKTEMDMEDGMKYYFNKHDSSGNRYFVTTINGRNPYKEKGKLLTAFKKSSEDSPSD